MTDKEVAELRRRLRPDRCSITKLYGCYIDRLGQIVACFDTSTALLPAEEHEKYLELLKKGISGTMGRTLSDLIFSTAQVQNGEEYQLLSRLREKRLSDPEDLDVFYHRIADSLKLGDNGIFVLIGSDVYDVPFRGKDGSMQADSGDTQFTHLICAICPVKETNPVLRYNAADRVFHNHGVDQIVGSPELGFLFPAFDDRASNIYGALLYNRSKENSYDTFVDRIFHTRPPMAIGIQKDTFRSVLVDALEEECSLNVVQSMHTQLRDMTQSHKEARVPEPLRVGCQELGRILEDSGVSEPRMASFRVKYEQAFGMDSELPPQNLIGTTQLEYKTPEVVIKVDPDRKDLIELRELGGVRYLMIKADEGIELNGVQVQ